MPVTFSVAASAGTAYGESLPTVRPLVYVPAWSTFPAFRVTRILTVAPGATVTVCGAVSQVAAPELPQSS
ncbi:hypothetical protein QR77_00265 [Streptomyces sp. 150FB]|nr:hypothetical protein QR77_00265 [Streptomyces sp. 150FB]